MSAKAVQALGVPALENLHRTALRGYAAGGLVGSPGKAKRALAGAAKGAAAQTVNQNVSAPVTVNASGGTPEQNADLAQRLGREMEATMRGVVQGELARQLRPGGALNRR